MQILSQQLTSSLQEESQKVSDADIEKYYKEKIDTYQEASIFLVIFLNVRVRNFLRFFLKLLVNCWERICMRAKSMLASNLGCLSSPRFCASLLIPISRE